MATAKNLANTVRGQEGDSTEDSAMLAKSPWPRGRALRRFRVEGLRM